MPTETEAIVETFPHPTLPKIEGIPTFASINDIHIKLNANAASIQSDLGNGRLGLLSLTVTNDVYNTLSDTPFIEPANPGQVPTVPAGTSSTAATHIRRLFDEDRRVFRQYHNTDRALKSQLIASVDEMYIKALRNRITGYAQTSTKQLLKHLYDTYGRLTPQDLKLNTETMNTPYDIHSPIENLFEQIKDAVYIASIAQAPFNPTQIVNTAYTLIADTNALELSCREWRRRPTIQKTWPNFKLHFAEAHRDYRESTNQSQHTFHSAHVQESSNLPSDTTLALANLASATALDRATVANLTEVNKQLIAQVADLQNKLNAAYAQMHNMHIICPPVQPSNNMKKPLSERNYCWTHGFKVKSNGTHTSATCTKCKDGHKEEATSTNRLGGSTAGM